MATELIERDVAGDRYEFEQFGAEQAWKVLIRLGKLVGKPFLVSLVAFSKQDKGAKVELLLEAVHTLIGGMDEKESLDLVKELTSGKVLCQGKIVKFDDHYAGRLGLVFKVLQAAVEVQFGNFLGELAEFAGSQMEGLATTPAK